MSNVSRPLEVIESEINFYKQQTATGIIEIGKRLIEAKQQLPHGEWGEWLSEKVEFSERTARQFMRVAEEFGDSQIGNRLPISKLYALLELPTETRTAVINNAPLEEMTKREVQELTKRLKQEQNHNQSLEETIKQMSKQIQELKNRPTEVKTEIKTVEVEKPVIPDDYEHIKRENQQLSEQNKTLLEQKQQLARQLQESRVLQSEIINIEEFRQNIGYFLEKMAKYTFYSEAFATLDKRQQNEFLKQVEKIDIWVTEVKQAIKGLKSEKTIIFEGGFISE